MIPEIPQHVADAIERAMSINSADRFATVEEFWQALEPDSLLEEEPEPVMIAEPVAMADEHTLATPPVAPISEELLHNETPQVRVHRTLRRPVPFALVLAVLILVGLLAGVLFGINGWLSSARGVSVVKGSSIPAAKQPATPVATLPQQATPVATHSPTPISTTQPTPISPAMYPLLVVSYSGEISDQFTNPSTDSTMTLSTIQQSGSTIHGYFSVGQGLIGNGNFTGSVTSGHKIQFLVSGNGWIAPLFFQGTVQQNGTLSGTYCSQQNGQCNKAIGGFGTWKITPSDTKRAIHMST
ncbi:MAG: hypothetical protein H0V70_02755 [Ktedonobacteraceae bacterium]|nr:hypothetical protein [Ktedonobacteraceae bacterium]